MDSERCCSHREPTAVTNMLITIRYGQTVYKCQITGYLWILIIGPSIPNARKVSKTESVRSKDLRTGRLYPQEIFLVFIGRPEGLCQ